MDPIADFLTRIRNATLVKHKVLTISHSKIKQEISRILLENGYIIGYKVEKINNKKKLKVALKYYKKDISVIQGAIRVSKPGLRRYSKYKKLPRVLNGLGIAIMTTSIGIITDKVAKEKRIGGEVICHIH
ncbi:30S ribosomal protein S8 [Blattabacterium cuenoti]|uniref:30S ribosomal protein S8 n=1 Tax=Blattabacterium cuenoti TaxID=1653831 RepID=UPI00163C9F20|nr:30S ribosomal protein S8 [Blattabacterium cuenoti]